jgi:hypothetical protein
MHVDEDHSTLTRYSRIRIFTGLDGPAGCGQSALRVLASANTRGLGPLELVEETASGRLAWRERAVAAY